MDMKHHSYAYLTPGFLASVLGMVVAALMLLFGCPPLWYWLLLILGLLSVRAAGRLLTRSSPQCGPAYRAWKLVWNVVDVVLWIGITCAYVLIVQGTS
jgi:hypothetical protein